jgi:hypothetical protein
VTKLDVFLLKLRLSGLILLDTLVKQGHDGHSVIVSSGTVFADFTAASASMYDHDLATISLDG